MRLNIQHLIDEAQYYAVVRELSCPDRVKCPHGGSVDIKKWARRARDWRTNMSRWILPDCFTSS